MADNRLITLTLIGRKFIDLEDPEYKNFSGVRLSKVIEDNDYFKMQIEVDGLRPDTDGTAGSETLGISDVRIANRVFSFITAPKFNTLKEDVILDIKLQKWRTYPYKFFTLWEADVPITHNTWLAKLMINPPLGIDYDNLESTEYFDTITADKILAIPVKLEAFGSLDNTFGIGANRRHTIEMKSVRSFTAEELYSMEGYN